MVSTLQLLPRLVPLLLRHAAAFVELLGDEAMQLLHRLLRELLIMAVALLCALLTLLLASTWIVSLAWNTQWRTPTITALLVLFASGAIAGVIHLRRTWSGRHAEFSQVRAAWAADRELLKEWTHDSSAQRADAEAQVER